MVVFVAGSRKQIVTGNHPKLVLKGNLAKLSRPNTPLGSSKRVGMTLKARQHEPGGRVLSVPNLTDPSIGT